MTEVRGRFESVLRSEQFVTSRIDLSKLPAPKLIESLSYDEIYEAMVADFLAEMKKVDSDYFLLPSDPAAKIIEVAARRELGLRARVNDAGKECMLAFASGTNLDHLVAFNNVERAEFSDVDPDTGTKRVETDTSLRSRGLLSPDQYSTTGAEAAYIFHVFKVSVDRGLRVFDVKPFSEKKGTVDVVLLYDEQSDNQVQQVDSRGIGQVDSAGNPLMVDKRKVVEDYLGQRGVKPLTEIQNVTDAVVTDFEVEAELSVPDGADRSIVAENAQESLRRYAASRYRVGADITVSGVHAALSVPNVWKVALSNMDEDIVVKDTEAIRIVVNPDKIITKFEEQ